MNDKKEMRKLMEALDHIERSQIASIGEAHGVDYVAAYLYINSIPSGRKPEMAEALEEATGIDFTTATRMIEAIDAYEDIREAEEFHIGEEGR